MVTIGCSIDIDRSCNPIIIDSYALYTLTNSL